MKRRMFFGAICFFAAFALWTLGLCFVDVQTVGPQGSSVGFATMNSGFHRLTGVHMKLYLLTDYLSLIPFCLVLAFALLGLCQWIKRKSLLRVERNILALGVFYAIVLAVYLFFEVCVVNYRPVLVNGVLEASYPSSTTVLVLCVMTTAAMQLDARIENLRLRKCTSFTIIAFSAFMLVGRLVSGVHWLSDIIGGVLLSAGLVMLYSACVKTEI